MQTDKQALNKSNKILPSQMMKPRTANHQKSHKLTLTSKLHQLSKTVNPLFNSNSLRHSKCSEDVHPSVKNIRVSLEKSEQIGQTQYKKAIKHMTKVDQLEKKQNQRKKHQQQSLTQQHTFQPKINHSSKTNYLYQSITHSMQKIHFRNHSKQTNPQQKFYDRLMKWGRNHDDRVRDNYLKGKVAKESVEKSFQSTATLSKDKLFRSKSKNPNLDNTRSSIQKIEQRLLNSLRSSNQTKRQAVRPYANGQQSFYQRQAKAVAMKNGQKYYYSTDVHSTA